MTSSNPSVYLLAAAIVVVGMVAPAAAAVGAGPANIPADAALGPPLMAAANDTAANDTAANGSGLQVTVGQQLSTVLSATSSEIQTEVENAAFELEFERSDESTRAEVLAQRADDLRERAEALQEAYAEATEAYEEGDLSKSEFAQRLASLNARAADLQKSVALFRERVRNVSAFELRVAGVNRSALRADLASLDNVTGAGSSALLRHFVGESRGELELETAGGLSIEASSEDGERSRELERPRDDNGNITVNQSDALQTARNALSDPPEGQWALQKASVHPLSGYYKFEFVLQSANATGEAEVRIDGSSGDLFRLEEEIEAPDDEDADERDERDEQDEQDERDEQGEQSEDERAERDEQEREQGERKDELAVVIASGTPAPNATVTVQVLSAGTPAANATVSLDGAVVGTTGPNGTVEVTLPRGNVKLTARLGDAEGELEFEFEDEKEDDGVFRNLQTTASIDDRTVTVTVTYNGTGVANATVYANDARVGTTGASGTLTFTLESGTEDLELEIVKGEFEAELGYTLQGDSLNRTEDAHAGDGDKIEDEKENDEREEDEETEDDQEEDETEGDDADEDEDG